jgi:hypothetical protein
MRRYVMSNLVQVPAHQGVTRIGILLGDLGKINVIALKYLILQMNRLQHTFEYEFLDAPEKDPFIRRLFYQAREDRKDIKKEIPGFVTRYQLILRQDVDDYDAQESPVERFVLLTMACFKDNYYVAYGDKLSVLAPGNWEDSMAPPSILEFILVLLLRASVNFISPAIQKVFKESMHLGTKGCLFDATPDLGDVRFKALNGFVCTYCRTQLRADHYGELADELASILDKKWLGKSTEPETPAGIIAKLGADLFITTGFELPPPTAWEKFKRRLEEEWVKQLLTLIITVIGAVLIALIVVGWLHLKTP